jgi:hypothetical protein
VTSVNDGYSYLSRSHDVICNAWDDGKIVKIFWITVMWPAWIVAFIADDGNVRKQRSQKEMDELYQKNQEKLKIIEDAYKRIRTKGDFYNPKHRKNAQRNN